MIRYAIAIALVAASTPVVAQKAEQLNIDISNGWTHAQSGVVFPATIGGLPFWRATQFAEGGWDNSLQYNDKDHSEIVSVYIYQAAVQDVGLLFAESRKTLETRKEYFGNVVPLAEPAAFAPPGQQGNSGLRITYGTDAEYRSTALAIAPLGRDWIVKFRVSSKSKTASELDFALSGAVAAISWPKDDRPHPVAAAMKDCANPFPVFKKKAKPAKSDGANALLNAVLAGMTPQEDTETPETPTATIAYCQDRSVTFPYGIYRPEDATDRYLISLGDSGRAVFVEPDIASMLLGSGKKNSTAYTVRFVGPGTVEVFPTHDRMPAPQQALDIMDTLTPVSSTSRNGGSNVTLNPSALD